MFLTLFREKTQDTEVQGLDILRHKPGYKAHSTGHGDPGLSGIRNSCTGELQLHILGSPVNSETFFSIGLQVHT